MMNSLHIGFSKSIDLPIGGFLFIDDEVSDTPQTRIFDPLLHSFNPLKNIDYKRARELVEVLYTTTPQGENTLTVRNGKRSLLKAILEAERFDKIQGDDEVNAMIADLLASPVLERILCNPRDQFSFRQNSRILARLNRAELGDFDALVLGLLLIGQFKGQVVIPDFGFYGRDGHVSLIREQRLIAGVNFLNELSPTLRRSVLLIEDKIPETALFEDAEVLAKFAGLTPETNEFNDFVASAVA